jgi:hypothetical protein
MRLTASNRAEFKGGCIQRFQFALGEQGVTLKQGGSEHVNVLTLRRPLPTADVLKVIRPLDWSVARFSRAFFRKNVTIDHIECRLRRCVCDWGLNRRHAALAVAPPVR